MLSGQFVCGRSSGVAKAGKFLSILVVFLLISNSAFGVKNFVLISAPGSGKGTFSQYLVKKHGYVQICPGDLFRSEIAAGTVLGKEIQPIVEKGEYVDEDIVCSLVAKHVNNALDQEKGFIIDGFPRSTVSFDFLSSLLEGRGITDSVCFLQFMASDMVCAQRILDRLVCTTCFRVFNSLTEPPQREDACDDCGTSLSRRSADTKEIVQKRLQYFHGNIEPLMKKSEARYPTTKIDSECSTETLKGHYEKLLQE